MKTPNSLQAALLGLIFSVAVAGTAVADADAPGSTPARTPVVPPSAPEPATLAMAAVGFLAVGGYLLYRRRALRGMKHNS